jgi:general secretion pathway protein K
MRVSRQPRLARRQRGVALIMAVLIVALATILAVNVTFRGMVDQRRSGNLFAFDQGYEVALGAEAWAADILRKDAEDSQTDHLGEVWAQTMAALPIDEGIGTVEGRLEDQQGRFNLNNLVFADGTPNDTAIKQLERILSMLEIEPTWAAAIADWIDTDVQPGFPDGAEDSVYMGLNPPHLAANMPITRASELMVLPEFGADRYRRLRPYVTALPVGSKLNALTPRTWPSGARTAASRRSTTCAARWARPSTTRSRTHFQNQALTSAQRYGSLLALPSSPCTVCSRAGGPAR